MAHARMAHLAAVLAPNETAAGSHSQSLFTSVPQAPADPIFGPQNAYLADKTANKVNLVVGAYRSDEGKPWVLPVVRKAEALLAAKHVDHEYLPIDGVKEFTDGAARLLLGPGSAAVKEQRVVSMQNLSGSGSLRLGSDFLAKFFPGRIALIPEPTWPNHVNIFQDSHFTVKNYRYFDPATNGLDFAGLTADLRDAPDGSVVLLHVCAHNPTGVDPSREQWHAILDIVKEKKHLTFFDTAYQGFATGDLEGDAYSVRLWEQHGLEFVAAQSFAKNMGLYGERTGCFHVVMRNGQSADNVRSQLKRLVRGSISNPPAYGARLAALVLNTDELFQEWLRDIKTMADRIKSMRQALFDALVELKTPGTWRHIIDQIGMFTYTGLKANQCQALMDKHHIYLTHNGRISIAGLNTSNVRQVAAAIDDVVRNVQ